MKMQYLQKCSIILAGSCGLIQYHKGAFTKQLYWVIACL